MAEHVWRDMIIGDRMQVDMEFRDRVTQSEFSPQEWELIMTAVELRLEGEGESTRLVADTDKVEVIMPELDRMNHGAAAMSGGSSSSRGLFGSLKASLGLGGGVDQERLEAATALADEYAAALQAHLEEAGKWDRISQAGD